MNTWIMHPTVVNGASNLHLSMAITILSIESSCDDTAAAIIRDGRILSNVVAGQHVHEAYGGVVPELASRAHQSHIVPVVESALGQAGVATSNLNGVAFTSGPGLLGSLWVGVSFAKGLALGLGIPLIEVHHLQAHVLTPFGMDKPPEFPYMCLLVSGGHTQIVLVEDMHRMRILGRTIDDAAGEAFDKIGKMLGLGYPAGPRIDACARDGHPVHPLPHPRLEGYDYSFSGLKTAMLYYLQRQISTNPNFISDNLADLCASVQEHISMILLDTFRRAWEAHPVQTLVLAGGVSANSRLRQSFEALGASIGVRTIIPPMALCTDNAAMIGIAGYYKYLSGDFTGLDVTAQARIPMYF
jgi:N6-L-threonylcarbamoyladenine synthase